MCIFVSIPITKVLTDIAIPRLITMLKTGRPISFSATIATEHSPDVTGRAGLDQNNNHFSFACGWADYNSDGWPDLYVANDFGQKNLYRNNGDGTFTDVASEAGVLDTGAGMSVCWLDYDNDGRQDLYVADVWTAVGLRLTAQDGFIPHAPERVRAPCCAIY
jgi:hypothetical protein